MSKTGSSVAKFKKWMSSEFDMSDLDKLAYHLGIKTDQTKEYTELK